jgi:hypothetical protein
MRNTPDATSVTTIAVWLQSTSGGDAVNFLVALNDNDPYHLELLRASEGTLSPNGLTSRLHLQSLAPTNPHWARVVDYGSFSLWVILKEGLCPSSGDINRLMMMMMMKW